MEEDDTNQFDQELANGFIGKTILIGITYQNKKKEAIEYEQLHGVIESASQAFIGMRLRGVHRGVNGKYIGDELWAMPPILEAIECAEPGFYELNNTGDTIDNPDLIAKWRVTRLQDR